MDSNAPRFLAVCLNPTFQRTISLPNLDKGEVNRARLARLDASGKGINVSRVLQQLGAPVRHLTHLGPGKDEFLRLCSKDGLQISWIDSVSPIRTCITLLDESEDTTTEVIEPTEPVDEGTVAAVVDAYNRELENTDWVILSGSKAPGYPPNLFAEFCRSARDAGKPVVADYRGEELLASLMFEPALVKINLVEFAATFLPNLEVSEADDSSALQAVKEKLAELSVRGSDFVLTRGARAILCARNGLIETVDPPDIVPVNTIGSGDSVAAGMAFALSNGERLREAVIEGARCGALNAVLLKPGSLE
ncbi:MAG: PfkB family carbohydrate kinase [Spirochaetaceae bacterium]|nr:PfkB family carbohydrate kinase [Spirochaetaceae bacterium]MDT8297246.1 PfkB family carbohydrate kinase [Spirochaetaceae bacterium]